jgi:hypothetical protein
MTRVLLLALALLAAALWFRLRVTFRPYEPDWDEEPWFA